MATTGTAESWSMAQRVVALFAAFAFCAEGMGTQAMGLVLPAILKDWAVTRTDLATPTALGLVGFAVGAVLGGGAGDRFGRGRALVGSLLLMGLATIACALAHNPAELGVIRIVAGLGLGATLPGAATLMAEAAPARHRSLVIAIGLAFLPIGGFVGGLVAGTLLPRIGWQGVFVVIGAVALAFGAAMLMLRTGAVDAGTELRGDGSARRSLALLMAPGVRRSTLGLWGAFFFTVLAYYSVFSWVPAAFTSQGRSVAMASGAISSFALGGLAGGLLAGWLVHRLGARPTLVIQGGAGIAAALALAVLARPGLGNPAGLIWATGALGAGIIGTQTALYAAGAQIYQAGARATGTGLAVGWGRIGAIASSYAGALSLDHGGVPGYFGCLALAALAALACGLLIDCPVVEARP